MNGNLMSTAEVARYLDKNVSQIAKYARSGDLPYAHKLPGISGAYLFDRQVVTMFKANFRDRRYRENRIPA